MLSVLLAPDKVSEPFCRAVSALGIGLGFGTMYMPTFVAIERYFYFCRPFQYTRVFTVKSVAGITCVLMMIPLVWSVVVDVQTPRQLSTTVLYCQLPNARQHLPLQLCLFLGPSILGIIFSTTMIRRLQTRAQSRVEPFPNNDNNNNPQTRSIRKGIRLIFLISGAFWGTYIPSWILRVQVLSTGITFEQLDNRVDITKFLLMRLHILLWAFIASALNPIVYFALHRDLRVAAVRLFGGSQQFSWEKEMAEAMNQSRRDNNSGDAPFIAHI